MPLMIDECCEFVRQREPFLTTIVAAVTNEPPMQCGFFRPCARKDSSDFEAVRAPGLRCGPPLLDVPRPPNLRSLAGAYDEIRPAVPVVGGGIMRSV